MADALAWKPGVINAGRYPAISVSEVVRALAFSAAISAFDPIKTVELAEA
jgi:hypothetical protein